MTTVHAYTSDQSLQDYAGQRLPAQPLGAEEHHSQQPRGRARWLGHVLPTFAGKMHTSYAQRAGSGGLPAGYDPGTRSRRRYRRGHQRGHARRRATLSRERGGGRRTRSCPRTCWAVTCRCSSMPRARSRPASTSSRPWAGTRPGATRRAARRGAALCRAGRQWRRRRDEQNRHQRFWPHRPRGIPHHRGARRHGGVAVNDLFDHDALRYLLNYDTVMGPFPTPWPGRMTSWSRPRAG
jgi:hypothetical protein